MRNSKIKAKLANEHGGRHDSSRVSPRSTESKGQILAWQTYQEEKFQGGRHSLRVRQ